MSKGDTELDRLKRFCEVVLNFMDEAFQPSGISDRVGMLRTLHISRSLRGVRQAARDMVEWGQDLDGLLLGELDSRLAALDLPTFSLMRTKKRREVARVLARGRVDSEEECRLLNAVVANLDSGEFLPADRALADRLLLEFKQLAR